MKKVLVYRRVYIKDMTHDVVGKVFAKKILTVPTLPLPGMRIFGLPGKIREAVVVPRGTNKKTSAAYIIFMEDENDFTYDGHFETKVNATHEKDVKKNLTTNGWTIVSEKDVPFC